MTVVERLRKLVGGPDGSAVDDSTRRRAEYSSDASNYRVAPLAVVFPRTVDDLETVVTVCRESGTPLTIRGGGTSVAGNAVGPGVIVDTSRHLTAVRSIDPDPGTAVVEPGVVLDDITRAARPYGLRYGPDPSTHARATIGGVLGNDSCGAHTLAYGRASDNLVALDVVTGSGQRLTLRVGETCPLPEVDAVVDAHLGTIRAELGRFGRQVSGYQLDKLLPEKGRDLARALVGSEGTCAVVLGATVRLVREPTATALAVLGYPDIAAAADALPSMLPLCPLAVEGLDARLVDVIRRRKGPAAVPALPSGGGWLLVEVGGETPAAAEEAARRLASVGAAIDGVVLAGGPTAAALWRIREDGAGLAGRTATGAPAWPGWEDAAVPPERLGSYLREFAKLTAHHGVDGLAYGHFGDGCIHVRLDFPLADAPARFRAFLLDAADLVAAHGGSLSGEHGDGRARSELLDRMYSPDALAAFAAFKHALDPDNLLNPGVLVDPRPVDADLRLPQADPIRRDLGFAYPEDGGDFTQAVHRCVGVGKCRADTGASGGFMCPSYLATRDERDSTRGRARVLQEMANGRLVRRGWSSPEVHDVLELCLSCKACASDCPAGVDMATYKAEVLHQTYRRRVRPVSHYTLGWLPRWTRLASRMPRLANALLERTPGSARRLGGVDPRRQLPTFAAESFRAWHARRGTPARDGRPVVLWVDTFTDAFAPDVGKAAVAVLESAGFTVQLSPPSCCGLTWISTGQLDAARRRLRQALDGLARALADGVPIVGLEPSCTAVLRDDVVRLLPDDLRAHQLAHSTRTLAELLTEVGYEPPRLDGLTVLAQPHCHQHAVMGFQADSNLLRDAGAQVSTVAGCCGLAGNFGVEAGHYDVSVAIAEHTLLPAVRNAQPGTVVLADGFSCRTQLADLAGVPARHLAELLAERIGR